MSQDFRLTLSRYSLCLLRLGLGLVFLVFGIGKLRADQWAQTMQSMDFFTHLPWSVAVSIRLAGFLEITTGAGLIVGKLVRFFSFCAALELIVILVLLYFQGVFEIRDIGLLAMALVLMIN